MAYENCGKEELLKLLALRDRKIARCEYEILSLKEELGRCKEREALLKTELAHMEVLCEDDALQAPKQFPRARSALRDFEREAGSPTPVSPQNHLDQAKERYDQVLSIANKASEAWTRVTEALKEVQTAPSP
ncbi:unnamed protein product [Durusdinium trenchii]|uniref:Tubulin-specific chaperone A n=1 Tax=Durusdinium trenchii TaxID=1381693 RepID=A0ABP0SZC8_9DINO